MDPEVGSVPYQFYRAKQPFSAVHGFVRITDQDPGDLQLDPVRITSAEAIDNVLQLSMRGMGRTVASRHIQ